MQRGSSLLSELKRRRVFRTAAVYAVVAFLVAQVADLLLPALLLPEWAFRMVVALLILGFPIALALAWSFDLTPDGVRRTDSPRDPADRPPPEAERDHDTADEEPVTGDAGRLSQVGARSPVSRPAVLAGFGALVAVLGFGGYHLLGIASEETGPPSDSTSAGRYSIAVLPLDNLAGDDGDEHFADGVTEDILTNLGLVPDFTVISRTSAMRYKGSDKSIPEIAAELGVRYVVEGSFRRDGQAVRIVVQLVEPATDTQIWAQTLDRRVEDVFALQSEVAQAVVHALRVELTGGVEERMGRAPTDDFEAYELFLHGRDYYYQYLPSAMEQAIELFDRAIERDPEFALAHAWKGSAYAVLQFNWGGDPALLDRAVEAAERAVELQPDLGDGHRSLGTALGVAGRFDRAIPALERAIELNPNDFPAIGNLGLLYGLTGDWNRAHELTHASIEQDPARSHLAYSNLASTYRMLLLLDRAEEAAHRALALRHDEVTALGNLAWIALLRGHEDAAVERAAELADSHQDPRSLGEAAYILLRAGDEARALAVAEKGHSQVSDAMPADGHAPPVVYAYLLQHAGETERAAEILDAAEARTLEAIARGHTSPALPFSLAQIAATRGQRSESLDHLERAVELGWANLTVTEGDPLLEPLSDDPRFTAVVDAIDARVGEMRQRVEARE